MIIEDNKVSRLVEIRENVFRCFINDQLKPD